MGINIEEVSLMERFSAPPLKSVLELRALFVIYVCAQDTTGVHLIGHTSRAGGERKVLALSKPHSSTMVYSRSAKTKPKSRRVKVELEIKIMGLDIIIIWL